MLEITLENYVQEAIIHFIRDFAGDKNVVVGMSGGLDSSVVAKLCVMALGKERVLGLHMPDSITPKEDTQDAREIADALGIKFRVVKIDEIVEEIKNKTGVKKGITIGNIKARIRMTILYGFANENNMLVAGTSNKSEILIGYFTKYGDGASDFAPVGDLYKTQVRILAKRIGIPDKIINKKPSANLVRGQYDENDIGVDYETLDRVLYGMEMRLEREKIAQMLDIGMDTVNRIYGMYENSRHKRVLLYIPKIGIRTVNTDWRE